MGSAVAPVEFIDEMEAIEAELARRKFRIFVQKAWHLVEPTQPFVPNWHIDVICDVLEQVSRGELDRVIINVPPGCMKSLLVSVMWPAWEWASRPDLRYLCASYGAHLSIRDNMRMREIITSPWYQRHYGVRLTGDQNAKQRFHTDSGGWRVATSVGGPGMGEHPDRGIVDDPHTAQEARSDVERGSGLYWFDRTLSTRGVARSIALVVIMQRLHEQDLSGHLLTKDSGRWLHVCFPMKFEAKRRCSLDQRRVEGELLWPELFTKEKVRELELNLGPFGAAGQLQQRPSPEGGGLFKREWFRWCNPDEVPKDAIVCRGWDTGGTEGGGDFTVGVKMALSKGTFYIVDVARGQWSPAKVETEFLSRTLQDGRSCRVREEQEPGSAGKTVIASRTRQLAGFDYRGVPITGDKVTRARPYRAQVEAGNVVVVRASWAEEYLQELEAFPMGAHDDQVDASSAAFNELTSRPTMRQLDANWG